MSKLGRDSYYVLVDKDGNVYTVGDFVGKFILDFNTEEQAKQELEYLVSVEELDVKDGWHVERHKW